MGGGGIKRWPGRGFLCLFCLGTPRRQPKALGNTNRAQNQYSASLQIRPPHGTLYSRPGRATLPPFNLSALKVTIQSVHSGVPYFGASVIGGSFAAASARLRGRRRHRRAPIAPEGWLNRESRCRVVLSLSLLIARVTTSCRSGNAEPWMALARMTTVCAQPRAKVMSAVRTRLKRGREPLSTFSPSQHIHLTIWLASTTCPKN